MLELVCRHHHLNSLVKFKGVVTRRTGVFPQLQMVKYNCVRCQMILGPFFQNNENEIKVGACPSCQSTGPFDVSSRLSTSTCCFHSCFAKAKIPHVCNACLNGHGIQHSLSAAHTAVCTQSCSYCNAMVCKTRACKDAGLFHLFLPAHICKAEACTEMLESPSTNSSLTVDFLCSSMLQRQCIATIRRLLCKRALGQCLLGVYQGTRKWFCCMTSSTALGQERKSLLQVLTQTSSTWLSAWLGHE